MASRRLTQQAVTRLGASDRDAFVWDTELRGFAVKVTPTGRKVYVVQYRHGHGRRAPDRRVTLARTDELTVEEARKLARATLATVVHGGDPAYDRREARDAETLGEVLPAFLDEVEAKKKPRTAYEWRRLLKRDVVPVLGRTKIRDLDALALSRLHLRMRTRPVMANRVLGTLSALLEWAERRGMRPVGSNPALGVERYREQERERYLTRDELRRLSIALATAETVGLPPATKHRKKPKTAEKAKHRPKSADVPKVADAVAVNAIRLLAFTGFREQEALSLRWDAIDFDRSAVTLADTKTDKSTRPLGAPALELLRSIPRVEASPYVFPGAKPGAHRVEIRRVWEAVREAAHLEGVRLHDLRHTVASVAVSGGASLPIIAAILGHKDSKSTQRYAHLIESARREAADKAAGDVYAAMNGNATQVISMHHARHH